jgi:hypothetical protein
MSIDIPSARATLVALFAGQVQLGGPATPGPAQRVIVGLDADTARRLSLLATTAAGAGGVLVGRMIVESTLTSHPIRPA